MKKYIIEDIEMDLPMALPIIPACIAIIYACHTLSTALHDHSGFTALLASLIVAIIAVLTATQTKTDFTTSIAVGIMFGAILAFIGTLFIFTANNLATCLISMIVIMILAMTAGLLIILRNAHN